MCEDGEVVEVANLLAYNGEWHRRTWPIDACIADLVKTLNDGGLDTIGSCCGHRKQPGEILLADRRLIIATDSHEDGLARGCDVARQRIGTARSRTVAEIINAYVGIGV